MFQPEPILIHYPRATSPHSNPEVAGSSLARSQCPYGSGFTPRLRLAGGGLRGRITSAVGRTVEYPPPPPPQNPPPLPPHKKKKKKKKIFSFSRLDL
ncbi:hypothetical protein Hanom_Chr14g01322951 [Helianthus anomalus]